MKVYVSNIPATRTEFKTWSWWELTMIWVHNQWISTFLSLFTGLGPREPNGQPMHQLAVWQLLGQHHWAGQADQLPRHHHQLWAVPQGLELVVHISRARDHITTRWRHWCIGSFKVFKHIIIIILCKVCCRHWRSWPSISLCRHFSWWTLCCGIQAYD